MHYGIDASNDWLAQNGQVAALVADTIVQSYSSSISQFINNQRQQMRLGIVEQQGHQWSAPGIDIDYNANQGDETIKITVKPEYVNLQQLPFLIDLNFDGYVAFVHNFGPGQAGFDPIPYDLLVNGTVVCTYTPQLDMLNTYTPTGSPDNITGAAVAVVIAFGPTALRAESLHDTVNPFNPKSPQHTNSMPGLTSKCQPSRAKIPDATGTNGGDIPQHSDLLGYFIWGPPIETTPAQIYQGWGDPFNPDDYAYDGDITVLAAVWAFGFGYDRSVYASPVQLGTVVQYESALTSPLNSSGKNVFQVQPNPEGLITGGARLQVAMIASANQTIAAGTAGANAYTTDAQAALNAATAMNNDLEGTDPVILAAFNQASSCPLTIDKTNVSACIVAEADQNASHNEMFAVIAYAENEATLNPLLAAAYTAAAASATTGAAAAARAAADAEAASNYEAGVNALAVAEGLTPAQLQAAAAENGLVEGQFDVVLAEFYDRKSLRVGTASWNYTSAPGGVLINDKPLYWNCNFDPTALGGVDFDLTPASSYPEASTLGQRSLRKADTTTQSAQPAQTPQPKRTIYLNGDWTFGPYS